MQTQPQTPAEEATFDIELKLVLEAIYLRYQHDFRHYSVSSLRPRLTQALSDLAIPTLSQLQERILRDAGALRAPVPVPDGAGQRDVSRSALFSRHPRAGRADSADLSVDQGLGRGMQQRRGTVVARGAVRGGEDRRSHACSTRPISTPMHLRQAENGIYALERMAELQSELSGGGRQAFAIGLLSRCIRRGAGSRRRSSRAWCSPITASPRTACSSKRIWCRAATC